MYMYMQYLNTYFMGLRSLYFTLIAGTDFRRQNLTSIDNEGNVITFISPSARGLPEVKSTHLFVKRGTQHDRPLFLRIQKLCQLKGTSYLSMICISNWDNILHKTRGVQQMSAQGWVSQVQGWTNIKPVLGPTLAGK